MQANDQQLSVALRLCALPLWVLAIALAQSPQDSKASRLNARLVAYQALLDSPCAYHAEVTIGELRASDLDNSQLGEILLRARTGIDSFGLGEYAWACAALEEGFPGMRQYRCRIASSGTTEVQEPLQDSPQKMARARIPPYFLTYSHQRRQLSILPPDVELHIVGPRYMSLIPEWRRRSSGPLATLSVAASRPLVLSISGGGSTEEYLFDGGSLIPVGHRVGTAGAGELTLYRFGEPADSVHTQALLGAFRIGWKADSISVCAINIFEFSYSVRPSQLSIAISGDTKLYDYGRGASLGEQLGSYSAGDAQWPLLVRRAVRLKPSDDEDE